MTSHAWPRPSYRNTAVILYLLGKGGGRGREDKELHQGWQETALETPKFVAAPPEHPHSPRRGTCASHTPHVHTQPKPGLAEREEAAIKGREAAKTRWHQSQYQRQHQGTRNSLKITNYTGVQRKILTWAVLGFWDKPLLREMVQQFWLCNNNSSPHWKEGRTHKISCANKPGKAPFSSAVPLAPSQPSACQPMPPTQLRLSHLFFGGLGVHKEEEGTTLESLRGWQRAWHTAVVVLVQETDEQAEVSSWKGRDWRQ